MRLVLRHALGGVMLVLAAAAVADGAPRAASGPSADLAPEDVVRIQVALLRDNDAADRGIAQVYRFASPRNRRQTGPLDRFTEMVRSTPYAPLLGHREARFGAIAIGAAEARQTVTIVAQGGEAVIYLWVLSRQTDAACNGCWMTDAVIPLDRGDDADRIDALGTVT
jgi:hypothetical protein